MSLTHRSVVHDLLRSGSNVYRYCAQSFAAAIVLFVLSNVAAAQGMNRFDGLDAYVADAMRRWQVPGLALAVVKDGEVVIVRGYGIQKVSDDVPVRAETVFPIASCTKSFTATGIALLVDDKQAGWDDPVRKHLPKFKVVDKYVTEHATLRDLLCHRTGLVHGDLLGRSGGFTRAEVVNQIQFLSQAAPFRSKMTYSNVMYTALGDIIADRSGLTWEEFLQRRLFDPLTMISTTTDPRSVNQRRLASRHRLYDGTVAPLKSPEVDVMAPAGAIYSTVGDMAKWLLLHLKEGELNGQQFVSKAAMREMHAIHQPIPVKWRPGHDEYDARFMGTGLGWFVRDYRGRKLVQHGGAWGAEMAFMPEETLGVIVLSNRDWNGLAWMLIYDLLDAYLVGPEQAWRQDKKWERWLKIGGPELAARDLEEARRKLEVARAKATSPSLPLTAYAGRYKSRLYPDLEVTIKDDRLQARFGVHTASFEHWEHDSFYGRAVILPLFDWLVKFDVDPATGVRGLEVISVGWKEPDERFLFERVREH